MNIEWQRAAAYVVAIDLEYRILLTKFEKPGHPKSGAWTLPGGGMEWGEQASETAIREVKEETGLEAEIGPLLGAQSEWIEASASEWGQPGLALRLIFKARNCAGALKKDFSDDDTTVAAAWFRVEDVHRLNRVEVVDFGIALNSERGLAD
ncbi:NUDIX hydrolase [Roseovarius sp. S4756]|uniref:NUDIX hydrolase n=1 Tax=Roseovarius maritimus TaxID=3342637 RepID=UPI0037295EE1